MRTLVYTVDDDKKKANPNKKPVAKMVAKNKYAQVRSEEEQARVLKAKAFERSKAIETNYAQQLLNVTKQIGQLLKNYDPNSFDSNVELIKALYNYANQITEWATNISSKIVYQLNKDDLTAWQEQNVKMSRGMRVELNTVPIEPLLKKYMEDQVDLITSLPRQAAERIHKLVYKNLYEGTERASGLADQIMATEGVTRSRAMLIARTEVSRVSTGLTEIRSTELGLGWYVWHSAHDVRTRKSHKLMDKVVCRWDDRPNPEKLFAGVAGVGKSYNSYAVGSTFNCRCYGSPIIRVDDVEFPVQVHRNGRITKMNREQFSNLVGNEIAYPVRKAA